MNEDNLADVSVLFQGYPDSREMLRELLRNYRSHYENGKRTNYGFYVLLGNELAGMTLLNVDRSPDKWNGSTGPDMFAHMRPGYHAPE